MKLEIAKYNFCSMDELVDSIRKNREGYRLDIKDYLITKHLLEEHEAEKMSHRIINKY